MTSFEQIGLDYLNRLNQSFNTTIFSQVEILANELLKAWIMGSQVFICGNGGSAANAIHMANDFHYGIGACGPGNKLPGLRVEALPANAGVITCLANDTGYENIYAHQINVKGRPGDIIIALSGSGNSSNIIRALEMGNKLGLKTIAILGFSGGKCLQKAKIPIHFEITDMQIAEDLQLIVGHLCMQWLNNHKPTKIKR